MFKDAMHKIHKKNIFNTKTIKLNSTEMQMANFSFHFLHLSMFSNNTQKFPFSSFLYQINKFPDLNLRRLFL